MKFLSIALSAGLCTAAILTLAKCTPLNPKAMAHEPHLVIDGLNNPSSVSFSAKGELTFCDSGNGRVGMLKNDGTLQYVKGFDTEYWKVDPDTGINRFKLGPLSAVWAGSTLCITDGGKKDGEETVQFYRHFGEAKTDLATNAFDLEGNLSGMDLHPDGKRLFICGQGEDSKSWVLVADIPKRTLKGFASADAHNIDVNSPMQCRVTPDGKSVLVVYSGTGGKEDGLIVQWDIATAKPTAQWTLPGLVDPMGMDFVPGTQKQGEYRLAVVDNNWALTEVKRGSLSVVTLRTGQAEATVKVISEELRGPVSCSYGKDKRLYVAELGAEFDAGKGRIVAFNDVR